MHWLKRAAAVAHLAVTCLWWQVNIWVPQPEKQLDVIKVTGLVANVERAKQGLLERVKELQAEQEDRVRNKTLDCHHLLNMVEYLGHYEDICELLLLLFRLSAALKSPCLSIQSFIPKSSAARGRSFPRSGKITMSASSSLIKEMRSRCVCVSWPTPGLFFPLPVTVNHFTALFLSPT